MSDLSLRDYSVLHECNGLPGALLGGRRIYFRSSMIDFFLIVAVTNGVSCLASLVFISSAMFRMFGEAYQDTHVFYTTISAIFFSLSTVARFVNSMRMPTAVLMINKWGELFFDPVKYNHINLYQLLELADAKMVDYARCVVVAENKEKEARRLSAGVEEREVADKTVAAAKEKFKQAWDLYDQFGILSEEKREAGWGYYFAKVENAAV